ncbi:hypothetical protein PHO31112_00748 [Pandoraea horticolens]|uniref:Uncharacterized protein n=1 Tax=Pandoraea horticolens TaxID=2508298 RepID=A0A5E4SF25_9BURK|nr:hypothetical protein [Pandoraea horticolens]VVD74257.1 hypothetical protein PHO31112_00748 [Pandoraea horticolens]
MSDLNTVTFDATTHQLVPKEPTDLMIKVGQSHMWPGDSYAAMLAAAPTPAAQSADHSGAPTEKVSNHVADVRNMVAAQSAGQEAIYQARVYGGWDDVSHAEFERIKDRPKRIVYAAPVNASKPVAIRYPDECIPQKDDSSFEFAFGWNSAIVRFKAMNAAPVNGGERVQWWLADIDMHGNPTLSDGAHSDRAGADKAAYLHAALGLKHDRKFAVARVELFEPKPSANALKLAALTSPEKEQK